MTRRHFKKLLASLILIGALGSITTGGTYAILTSDTQNASSVVASSTLTMSNTSGATTCTSQSGSTNTVTSGCAQLFTTATLQYPSTLATVNVQVTNTGSAPGWDLGLSMPGATAGAGCSMSTTPSAAVIGGGNPCGASGDLFYVQETQSNFTTPVHCWYPAGGTTCSIAGGGTINAFSTSYYFNGTCSPGCNNGPKLNLGNDASTSPATQYALAPSASQTASTRYFVIGVQEGTSNTLQGETATFSLLWHLDSAA